VNLPSAAADPLADELRASGVSLSYTDWADVHAGRHDQVAQRVVRRAKWQARRSITINAACAAAMAYILVRHFHSGPKLLLVVAGTCGVWFVSMVPLSVLVYRISVSAADRFRRAAAEAQRPGVGQ
jgi:hypothetical protein